MNKKILLTSFCFIFLLCSCKGKIRYGVDEPFIKLETQEKGELKDVMPSTILNKIENKDTFLLLIHSTACEHCQKLMNETITPYLETHPFVFYGLERLSIMKIEAEESNFNSLVYGSDDAFQDYVGYPYVCIYQEGVFIKGEQYLDYVPLFLETYLITDISE